MVNGPVNVTYKTIQHIDWPQDKAVVPNGFGGMTRIDFDNRHNVGQEGFVYGNTVLTVANNGVGQVTIAIQPDADFWCDQILMQVAGAGATSYSPKVTIKDIRTGYLLTYPYARFHNFQNLGSFNTAGVPTCDRLSASLFKPYCFTRNGGIGVTVENQTGASADFYLAFLGWKEYEHVSR